MQAQATTPRLGGMVGFTMVWLGQIVSVLASGMTSFAMTIYMYQQTKSALAMGLVQVSYILPFLLMSPIAGVMVDRYNRKLMMMVSDIGGGLAILALFILFVTGRLQFWHLYILTAVLGIGTTFQWPAYSAAISVMIPKEQYGRANGMMSLIEAGPGVVAPLLAGALLPFIGIGGILLVDAITYGTAILALIAVFIPQPPATREGKDSKGGLLQEAAFGFKYIFTRPSLLGLQLIFFVGNLFSGISFAVQAPMILARTNQSTIALGSVQSAASIGMVVGGVVMSAWGGFKKRTHGVLAGWMLASLAGMILFSFGRDLSIWIPTVLIGDLFVPLINGSNQAIWQAKVAPDLQGRVFSARRLIAWFTNPISPIVGGALADFVLEPTMKVQGAGLTPIFGSAFGSGPGSGMALLFFFCGLGAFLVGLTGYFIPVIHNAENILPDHDTLSAAETATA
jgi:MFS family permease